MLKSQGNTIMSKLRHGRGSAISEFGPALFILLVIVFFPMVDLLGVCAGYVMSEIYHNYMIREIALSSPPGVATDPKCPIQTQAAAITKVTNSFQSSSFFNFLNMKAGDLACTQVVYQPNQINPTTVICTTSTTIKPFISIPYWGTCPGLNAPYTFTITSERPQEETGRN